MTEANPKLSTTANDDDAAVSKARRIKDKIAASTARSAGKGPARSGSTSGAGHHDGPDNRSLFTRAIEDHPLALVAGGVMFGAIAASLIPASVVRKLGSRAFGLAALAGEMGALYGGKALEKGSEVARAGQEKLEDLGETAADHASDARARAIELGTLAAQRAIELAHEARANARDGRGEIAKRVGAFADRVRS